jgi:hypothetical protein
MKLSMLILPLILITSTSTKAQNGSLADQQKCYQQSHQYVADKTATQKKIGFSGEPAEPHEFEQAHYDAKAQICYVEYTHVDYTYALASTYGHRIYVMQYFVDNAFEGREIAGLTIMVDWTNGYVETTGASSGSCHVNGEKCSSHAEFNGLLWVFIPAFRPVEARPMKDARK